jgi:N,N-dimethylformamidase beta subunit-like protein
MGTSPIEPSNGELPRGRRYLRKNVLIVSLIVFVLLVIGMFPITSSSTGDINRIFSHNFLNESSNDYIFSLDRSVSTPNDNSHTGAFGKGFNIALVEPTFTVAAYSHNGFYDFYRHYINAPAHENITSDLDLLKVKVGSVSFSRASTSAYAMLSLLHDVGWVTMASNITTLSDQDVDGGKIFGSDGRNAFDVLVLGHQEYVTQREYDNLRGFVHNGGTMIILDGNVFYAQVSYDRATDTIRVVKGHGWAFNGSSAWKDVLERWVNETREWVGSNYLCARCTVNFGNDPFGYQHHEEQYVTNPNDVILLNYNASVSNWKGYSGGVVIATYELNYGNGKVIALGIYSDDVIANGKFDRYLDSLLLKYGTRQIGG